MNSPFAFIVASAILLLPGVDFTCNERKAPPIRQVLHAVVSDVVLRPGCVDAADPTYVGTALLTLTDLDPDAGPADPVTRIHPELGVFAPGVAIETLPEASAETSLDGTVLVRFTAKATPFELRVDTPWGTSARTTVAFEIPAGGFPPCPSED